ELFERKVKISFNSFPVASYLFNLQHSVKYIAYFQFFPSCILEQLKRKIRWGIVLSILSQLLLLCIFVLFIK
ncbi:MAG: hypothetical protein N3E41_08925, partial [Thermofilaceae archaeon]|nr:hypothetical protein [Thermofilaceae archaeon]